MLTSSTDAARRTARALPSTEGLLCGPSSGINVAASLTVAAAHPELGRIVTVIPDTGQRYLSGELWGEGPTVEEPARDHALDPEMLEALEAHRSRLEFLP